jgi:hypothetical protein
VRRHRPRSVHAAREAARAPAGVRRGSISEFAKFVGTALLVLKREDRLRQALEELATIAKEMSHRLKNRFAVTDGMIYASAKAAETPTSWPQRYQGDFMLLRAPTFWFTAR